MAVRNIIRILYAIWRSTVLYGQYVLHILGLNTLHKLISRTKKATSLWAERF